MREKAFFGQNADRILESWNAFNHLVKKAKLKHLFQTLPHLKLHLALDVSIVTLRTSKDAFNSWVSKWMQKLCVKNVSSKV